MNIRQTSADDRSAVEKLITTAPWSHVHLDWLDPTSLASKVPFLLASVDEIGAGLLGCPPDLPGATWLRTFVAADGFELEQIWDELWTVAMSHLLELEVRHVAAVSMEDWFTQIVLKAGFKRTNSVIFYERGLHSNIEIDNGSSHQIRPIRSVDESLILELDHLAFSPIWQLSSDALSVALIQASSASLIEDHGEVLGYQITTMSPFGAHLARLAVRPSHQREGLGTALVSDATESVREYGLDLLSVNTQEDNSSSRRLYEKLGFEATGKKFPVFEIDL